MLPVFCRRLLGTTSDSFDPTCLPAHTKSLRCKFSRCYLAFYAVLEFFVSTGVISELLSNVATVQASMI
jgi:hypothetical protein